MKPPCSLAYSTTAGWKVFYGDPFKYMIFSSIAAMQYRIDDGID
jgi:hypothetical protein